jgi:hypothetical protein
MNNIAFERKHLVSNSENSKIGIRKVVIKPTNKFQSVVTS